MTTRQSKATTVANLALLALIREAFTKSELTQDELAKAAGIPRGTIAKILSEKQLAPVYADQLVGLADALDADLGVWVREIRKVRDSAE